MSEYTREELIEIATEATGIHVDRWTNRDSPDAMQKAAMCLMWLRCGCDFHIRTGATDEAPCISDEDTIWLDIKHPTFETFEWGETEDVDTFYLPTRSRLDRVSAKNRHWY